MKNQTPCADRPTATGGRKRRTVSAPAPTVSVYIYDAARLHFVRTSGSDTVLPESVIGTKPRLSHIAAPYVLTTTEGRIISGLRTVNPKFWRGDLFINGKSSLLIVRNDSTADLRQITVFHFISVHPKLKGVRFSRLVSGLNSL